MSENAKLKSVGNMAKMREALEFADKELRNATEDDRFGDDLVYLVGCMRMVAAVCRAALAEPPRNCDRLNPEERYYEFCARRHSCSTCPYNGGGDLRCDGKWLLATVNESEAEK